MGNIGTTATIILILVIFLAGINVISPDISSNSNLDSDSIALLNTLGVEYQTKYNVNDTFEIGENDITNSSTFLGVDAFARQYLEDKSEIQEKQSVINRVLTAPSLFLTMFGVDNNSLLILWNTAIYSFLGFMLALQAYKAIRTGEVD